MNRKEQIEKVILKELHDIKIIKKVRQLNEYQTRKTLQKKVETAAIKYEPETVISRQALKNLVKLHNEPMLQHTGDTALPEPEETPSTAATQRDAEENKAARARLGMVAEPKAASTESSRPSVEQQQADKQRKDEQIKSHLDQLSQINPALNVKKVLGGMTGLKNEYTMELGEIDSHLKNIESTHPHMSHATNSLRKLLGM